MNNNFKKDVIQGLRDMPKHLSSKYFYDAEGDRLFKKIMELPEYYLTRCEFEILNKNKDQLLNLFSGDEQESFDLIELGSGDGFKTKILLEHFVNREASFRYYPIDISENVLNELISSLNQQLPSLNVKGIAREYFDAIDLINQSNGKRKKVVLFMGSNIGNFDPVLADDFLMKLSNALSPKDMVLIGFDLKKDPDIIEKAYDDSEGVTRDFNLNLLKRINNELRGNFQPENFSHHAFYNPETGKVESYLVSTKQQEITVAGETFYFNAWETIHTEISQKFDQQMIQSLCEKAGFMVKQNFFDEKKYYADVLWQKN